MRISALKMRLSRSGLWTEAQGTFPQLRARLRQPRARRRWPPLHCGQGRCSRIGFCTWEPWPRSAAKAEWPQAHERPLHRSPPGSVCASKRSPSQPAHPTSDTSHAGEELPTDGLRSRLGAAPQQCLQVMPHRLRLSPLPWGLGRTSGPAPQHSWGALGALGAAARENLGRAAEPRSFHRSLGEKGDEKTLLQALLAGLG